VTLWFRKTIENVDDFGKLMKMSGFNTNLPKEDIQYLYDFIKE
jgi:TRAP-type mannitol/chloroaromatic compound transport system substrate-binding protein